MNFKTKWVFSSTLITLFASVISIIVISLLEKSDPRNPWFSSFEEVFSVLVFFGMVLGAPAIALALPPAIFLIQSKDQKNSWVISNISVVLFVTPIIFISLLIFINLILYPLLIRIFTFIPESWIDKTIIPIMFVLSTIMLSGSKLANLQRTKLNQLDVKNIKSISSQWYQQVIKASLRSGIAILLLTTIDIRQIFGFSFSFIINMLSITLPFTLLTAAPAAQLHEALTAQNQEVAE